jgi:hypothetical protein
MRKEFWRGVAVCHMAYGAALLSLYLGVKHALPALDDWMLRTALHHVFPR